MKRQVIKIDEELCNGCGLCVTGCHEGALQLIDGKARIINEVFCDGLGACIGECPVGAIEFEERETAPYDEYAVMEQLLPKGENTIKAHLLHLKEHNEMLYFNQGLQYLEEHNITLKDFNIGTNMEEMKHTHECGCPGGTAMSFNRSSSSESNAEIGSQLSQWPVQLHLINPQASYYRNADVVLAADCAAFAYGNFHNRFLKNNAIAIACPKLDSGREIYVEKLTAMIDFSNINTLSVIMMEVPCCGGLLQMAKEALSNAQRKIPIKKIIIGLQGDILKEEWV